MNLEEIIKDYNNYAKNNPIFEHYRKSVRSFVKQHPLDKIINYDPEKIYKKGEDGDKSYLRVIGKEDLMGTRVGQIYTNFPSYFEDKNAYDTFKAFISDLSLINKSNFSNSFKEKIVKKGYFEKLSTLKTALIQIISCYFPNYFLPIYNPSMLNEIVSNLKIELSTQDQEIRKQIISQKNPDFSEWLLLSNSYLIKQKNNHKIMKNWNNTVFTHFLFMCLPFEKLQAIRELDIGLKYLDHTNEQFVVGIFSRVHEKLGFKYITRLKTSYPDAEVEDEFGNVKAIEFEYNSSAFKSHIEKAEICNIIVCWHNDLSDKWKQKIPHIEIIAFEDILDSDSVIYKKLYGDWNC